MSGFQFTVSCDNEFKQVVVWGSKPKLQKLKVSPLTLRWGIECLLGSADAEDDFCSPSMSQESYA